MIFLAWFLLIMCSIVAVCEIRQYSIIKKRYAVAAVGKMRAVMFGDVALNGLIIAFIIAFLLNY